MSEKAQKTRDQIDSKYKWNIEAMFSDESQIEPILQEVLEEAGSYSDFAPDRKRRYAPFRPAAAGRHLAKA